MSCKKLTKKYTKDFYKRLEDVFWNIGTIQCRGYSEVAFVLDLEDDNRIKEAINTLEDQGKLSILVKGLEFWITPVPF